MSTQCKSEFANRLARRNWNLASVLALARYPRIYSLTLNAPSGDGLRWSLFDSQKFFIKETFKLWRNTTTKAYPNQSMQIPKEWDARLLFISAEYNEMHSAETYVYNSFETPETFIEVVFENKKVYRFVLEKHPQVRNIPCPSNGDGTRVINYCPICAEGLLAPDKIDEKPLRIVNYGVSQIWNGSNWDF